MQAMMPWQQQVGPPKASTREHPTLPFDTVDRNVLETTLRNPHRKYIPEDFTCLRAFWPKISAGKLDFLKHYVHMDQENTDPVIAGEPPKGEVEVRALIVTGVAPQYAHEHIVKGVEIIASAVFADGQDKPHIAAYGGLVPAGDDKKLAEGLVELLKLQLALSVKPENVLKFCDMEYTDGRKTTYFVVAKLSSERRVMVRCQATGEKTEYQAEEEVLDEEADAAAEAEFQKAKAERAAEKAKAMSQMDSMLPPDASVAVEPEIKRRRVMKKVSVKKFKNNYKKTLQPIKLHLAAMINYTVTKNTPSRTTELCMVLDALDECIRREMVSRAALFLADWKNRKALETEALRVRELPIEEKKAKYPAEDAARKEKQRTKGSEFLAKWKEQDDGRTDEEKKVLEHQRQTWIQEQFRQEDEAVQVQRRQEEDELRTQMTQGKPVLDGGRWWRVLSREDAVVSGAFQYLDRGEEMKPSGYFPVDWLEELLLALPEYKTRRPVRKILDNALNDRTLEQGQINYRLMCTQSRKLEVHPQAPPPPMPTE
eukprot:TRINITY_DN1944_c0_g2_i1.p1 TRINITY_DN1944_c0_g2~~TRINITY_DN1944_c0_g2_i1.p1  ORF type:complete len:566 (+),score=227.56 TRINITY_DN1944_c0_g2_i1:81-1700(+)